MVIQTKTRGVYQSYFSQRLIMLRLEQQTLQKDINSLELIKNENT